MSERDGVMATIIEGDQYQLSWSPVWHELRVFNTSQGESAEDKSTYSFSMNVVDVGNGKCRLQMASGVVKPSMFPLMVRALMDAGFKQAEFETSRKTVFSRFAREVGGNEHRTQYLLNIEELAERFF